MIEVNSLFFLLGSPDPEMARMKEVLELLQVPHSFATVNGTVVRPDTAYNADPPSRSIWKRSQRLIYIECAVHNVTPYKLIDHHRPGDPGYGKGAADFWKASSIGQLFSLLNLHPSNKDLLLAAMDHCYADAVHGRCPGIDPSKVRELRISNLFKQLRQMLDSHAKLVTDASVVRIGAQEVIFLEKDLGIGYSFPYLIAQIVAVDLGVPVILRSQQAAGGPWRLHLCGANVDASTVETFMDSWAPDHGLGDIYGVPRRGYAGGYIQGSFNESVFLK